HAPLRRALPPRATSSGRDDLGPPATRSRERGARGDAPEGGRAQRARVRVDERRSAGVDGGGDPVEEPPPELERATDGPAHVGLERRRGRQTNDDVITDRAVLAIRPAIEWRGTPTPSPKRMKRSGCDTLQPEMRPVSSS